MIVTSLLLQTLFGLRLPEPRPAEPAAVMEARLARMVNAYRRDYGLPPVPLSASMGKVARAHVRDLVENQPDRGGCSMHSWSASGPWRSVCYTRDHAAAELMWSKPREITGGRYKGNGYEIAYRYSAAITPEIALDGWIDSRSHDQVMLEHGPWEDARWQAMGVGMLGGYAVIWFGKERDR